MQPERFELPIRIVVEEPVPGLAVALQRGKAAKATLVPPSSWSSDAVVFAPKIQPAPEGAGRPLPPYNPVRSWY
jgi:hypothetical protein